MENENQCMTETAEDLVQEYPLLEASLKELCRILLRMGSDYCGEALDEGVALHIDFDDSIIEDEGALFERDCRMLELGVLSKEEFRAKWMNEDLKTSGKAIQEIPDKETS